MNKYSNKRLLVECVVHCDTDKLYGTIDEAIAYLKEIKEEYTGYDIQLVENWSGYENMEMAFQYSREEDDEEYNARMEVMEQVRSKKKEESKRNKEKDAITRQIKELENLRKAL